MEWLYNNYRWDTRNYLIEQAYNVLQALDSKFLKLLPNMIDDYSNKAVQMLISNNVDKRIDLPEISHDELDKLFCDFLDYIKAPQEWMDTYRELKQNGKMVVNMSIAESACVSDADGVPLYLVIKDDGTINTFYTLIHEFIHYVSNSCIAPFSISEFPSIFFERLATNFLREGGYSNDAVGAVIRMRNENNFLIFASYHPLYAAIRGYIDSGCSLTSREDLIKPFQENYEAARRAMEKQRGLNGDNSTLSIPSYEYITYLVDSDCDYIIGLLQGDSLSLSIKGFKYILGTYLAEDVLEKSNSNPEVLSLMVQITSRIADTNLENILTIFGMEDLFNREGQDSSSKKFIKSKE